MKNLASPRLSEAIRMRSAFMLSTMYLKPLPSSPIRFSAGTSRLSKNTSQVLWLIMASILRISTPLPFGLAQVDQEHREPVGALLHLVGRRGAGEQQHQVGVQHARRPHLLAVDDVAVVALLLGARLELGGVGAGGGLGDAEGLQAQRARGDARQILLLLRGVAVPQHRAHGVHLGVAGRRVAAGSRGWSRGWRRRPTAAARRRRTPPGSARRDSRPRSAR